MASSGQEHAAAADPPASGAPAAAIPAKDAVAAAALAEPEKGSAPAQKPTANARPEREANFKDYVRIFTYAKRWDYVLLAAATIASIGAGTTLPLMNVVFGKLVGSFTAFADPTAKFDQRQFESDLNRLALFLFILFLARFALNYINKFAFRMIGIRMSAAIRLHYLQSLFGQSIHVLDSMPSGAAAGTITSTSNTLQLGISEKLGTFVEYMSLIVTALIIAFTYNWELTLVTASTILFIAIAVSIILPVIIKFHTKMTKAEAKASSVASEAFSSIRMVMACGAEQSVLKRYSEWVKKAQAAGQVTSPMIALQFGVIFFAVYAAFGLAFWYGAKMFANGRLDNVGTVVIVLMSVMMMVFSLERISTPMIDASKAMVAAAEFFSVIDAPRPDTGSLGPPDVSATEDIVLSGVDFAYPSRPHVKVLDNLNLTIEKGKVTAIVGSSGSGKSTIVGLIERWYSLSNDQYVIAKTIQKDKMEEMEKKKKEKARKKELKRKKKAGEAIDESSDGDSTHLKEPDTGPPIELKGTIETCGHNINEIKLKWWRSQVGLVQQEPFLFNDTIFNNVAHGLIGSEFEDATDEKKKELVEEACKESFADEFIDRLPEGYQTKVGDAGAKLSGGQRQRIAIARSIIKKPKILILDEATSAIDVRGERIVQAALDKVSKGRTTITIAHRLSTIKTADKICVMKKGRCVEEGTHDSLLQDEGGIYYGLVHAQQLALGDENEEEEDVKEESIGDILAREKSAARSEAESAKDPSKWKEKGLITGFGVLLAEQKSRLPSYILTIFFAMTAATAIPIQAYLFAKILLVFNFKGDDLLRESAFWALMWVVCAIGVGLSYFFLGYISTHLQHYICATYRMEYFENILYQKTEFFDDDKHAAGPMTAAVAGDPKQLEQLLGMNMGMVYTALFSLVGGLAIAFAFGWKLALVAFFVTVPLGFGAGFYRIKYEIEFEKMYAAVFAESSSWASESIGAFRTVTSLTLEDVICTRYEELLRRHVTEAYKSARWRTFIFALSDSMALGCQALIFWYGGRLVATREYDVVAFFICYMAVIQGAEAAGNGLSFGPNAAQAAGASNRILKMRETRNKDLISVDEKVPDTEGGVKIELEDLHFKYPTRNVSIFRGLNITIEKGQFAALVGASGSGKTSIVSLLERFYDPAKGRILFNGKDINNVNVYEYRKLLSLVAQEASLFQGTFRENILLGVDPATVSEERLHEVCRDASIHDFIVSLPDGYNTDVGSKGVSLSGGQRQRLAIARALIRDPSVLLLDEATSSLDSETEKQIQATFERVAKGRTTVAVAHRLSTIQRADVIYVLGEGKVLEKGNHTELLKKRGVYWNMCQSQALDR